MCNIYNIPALEFSFFFLFQKFTRIVEFSGCRFIRIYPLAPSSPSLNIATSFLRYIYMIFVSLKKKKKKILQEGELLLFEWKSWDWFSRFCHYFSFFMQITSIADISTPNNYYRPFDKTKRHTTIVTVSHVFVPIYFGLLKILDSSNQIYSHFNIDHFFPRSQFVRLVWTRLESTRIICIFFSINSQPRKSFSQENV